MRVALFCCWLDCDSSLAGASFVIRVCNDGSDLQDRDRSDHNTASQTRIQHSHTCSPVYLIQLSGNVIYISS